MRIIITVIVTLCTFSVVELLNKSNLSAAHNSLVRMQTSDNQFIGTGFGLQYKGRRFIVTAAHVCRAIQSEDVVMRAELGNTKIKGRIKTSLVTPDVCIIKLSTPPPVDFQYLFVSSYTSGVEEVKVVGYPAGLPRTTVTGYLGRIVQDTIPLPDIPRKLCTGEYKEAPPYVQYITGISSFCTLLVTLQQTGIIVFPGNSGSPTVNADGEVVGVVSMSNVRTNFGLIVTREDLLKALEVAIK